MTVVQNEATLSEKRRPGTGSSPRTAGSQSVNLLLVWPTCRTPAAGGLIVCERLCVCVCACVRACVCLCVRGHVAILLGA